MRYSKLGLFALLIVFISSCSKVSIEEKLHNAEIEFKEKNYKSVVIQLKNIIKDFPQNVGARLLLGKTYYELGSFLSADKEFNLVLKNSVNIEELLPEYVSNLYGLDDAVGIIDFWALHQSTLTADSKAELAPVVALAYLNRGNFITSKEVALNGLVWAQETDNLKLIYINSVFRDVFASSDKLTVHKEKLTQACSEHPEEWILCSLAANASYISKDFSEAAKTLENILIQKPNHFLMLIKMADSYLQDNDFVRARKPIEVLLVMFPNQPYVNQMASILSFQSNEYEKALQHINVAALRGYSSSQTKLISSLIHYQLGNYEQAILGLKNLKNTLKQNDLIDSLYIATQLKLGQTDLVYPEILELQRLDKNTDLVAMAALELFKLGKIDDSSKLLAKVDPDKITNPEILAKVSVTQLITNQENSISEIEKLLSNIIEVDNSDKNIAKNKSLVIASLLAQKNFQKARQLVDKWIYQSPKEVSNYLLQAEIYKHTLPKQLNKAIQAYDQVISIDKNNLVANVFFGKSAFENENYERSHEFFSLALKSSKNDIRALKGYYLSGDKIGQSQNSLKEIESLLADYNEEMVSRVALAKIYLLSMEPEKAIALFKKNEEAQNIYKNQIMLINAEAHLLSKKYDDAINYYNSFFEDNYPELSVLNRYLLAFKKTSNLKGAKAAFESMQKKHPKSVEVGLILANIQILSGNPDTAVKFVNSLLPKAQQHHISQGIKGKALFHLNKFNDALPPLLDSYKKSQDSEIALYIFHNLIKLNRSKFALSHALGYLEEHSDDLVIRLALANEMMKSNKKGAILQYIEIVMIDDTNYTLLNNLAWLLYEEGEVKQAKVYIDRAISLAPNNAAIQDSYKQIKKALNHAK